MEPERRLSLRVGTESTRQLLNWSTLLVSGQRGPFSSAAQTSIEIDALFEETLTISAANLVSLKYGQASKKPSISECSSPI
ncbi:hypothetical protein ACH5RR_008211 [Cinchona calisaya]|uniref:Uncharacterized protein n=1 Tax=Cinchona calisaya TaxID=153742 RepID=A0ABD3ACH6_9GENT